MNRYSGTSLFVSLTRKTPDDDKPDQIKIEDFKILAKLADNKINADLYWDDDEAEDHNKAHIKSVFVPHEQYGA